MSRDRDFIGRARELEQLNAELDRNRPSVIVVYGRRRVGKSRLLSRATRDRRTIYYQATEVASSINLEALKTEVAEVVDHSEAVLDGLTTWEGVLQSVVDRTEGATTPLTLVLDEFPYLCEGFEALPSVIQKVTDSVTERQLPFNLVLCGSRISFMEDLLGEQNPLRGRQTLEMELEPMPYREAAQFFAGWSPVDRLKAYGVFGGMPFYLQLADVDDSFRRNVEQVVLESGAPLHNEALNVLRAELSKPTRYATILQAIAQGCTTTGEIVGRAREIDDGRALAPYLEKLIALRLVRAVRSLDAAPKSRNRRYYLEDALVSFWYRFGSPNSSALTVGHVSQVWEHAVEPEYDTYMGEVFEEVARQHVARYVPDRLPTAAREVGKIWGSDYDIDVACELLDGTVSVGECKWWDSRVGRNVLEQLKTDAEKTTYTPDDGPALYYLFAKTGFTPELIELAADTPELELLTPDDLLQSAD